MLKTRVTIVSLLIIVVAGVVYLVSNIEKESANSKFYAFINPENIKQIAIEQAEKRIILTSHDNKWFVADNNTFEVAVDSAKILPLFEFINDARIVQKITKKESAYPKFDISGTEAVKVVFQNKDQSAHIFHLGKQKDYSSQFVRKEGDPYVYLISKRLSLNLESDTWFYKKVLDYDFSTLDKIAYTCDQDKILNINYNQSDDKLFINEPPEGKQPKNLALAKLRDDFLKISVSKYLQRSQKIDSVLVVSHTLHFRKGESVTLAFLKSSDEKSNKHYLDIKVDAEKSRDNKLQYSKAVSDQYLFELSWFDKKKYQRAYDDFFEEKPEKETTPQPAQTGTPPTEKAK